MYCFVKFMRVCTYVRICVRSCVYAPVCVRVVRVRYVRAVCPIFCPIPKSLFYKALIFRYL